MTEQQAAQMTERLGALGLPYERIRVFGAVCCNVHVVCLSRGAAQKWSQALVTIFPGNKANVVRAHWNAVANKGTSMLPTQRKGFLVAIAG